MPQLFKVVDGPDTTNLVDAYMRNEAATFDFEGDVPGIVGYIGLLGNIALAPFQMLDDDLEIAVREAQPGLPTDKSLHYLFVQSSRNSGLWLHGPYNSQDHRGLLAKTADTTQDIVRLLLTSSRPKPRHRRSH